MSTMYFLSLIMNMLETERAYTLKSGPENKANFSASYNSLLICLFLIRLKQNKIIHLHPILIIMMSYLHIKQLHYPKPQRSILSVKRTAKDSIYVSHQSNLLSKHKLQPVGRRGTMFIITCKAGFKGDLPWLDLNCNVAFSEAVRLGLVLCEVFILDAFRSTFSISLRVAMWQQIHIQFSLAYITILSRFRCMQCLKQHN